MNEDGVDWVQAPDGSWQQRLVPAPRVPPSAKPFPRDKRGPIFWAALLVLVLVVVGVVWSMANSRATRAESGIEAPAAGTRALNQSGLACTHFGNVAGDAKKGLLTGDELREKLKEVNDNAMIATPAVKSAAEDLLRAATVGDSGAVEAATVGMYLACTAAGYPVPS